MKKAKEWIANEPMIEAGAPFICATEEVIEAIQADARHAALLEAAGAVDDHVHADDVVLNDFPPLDVRKSFVKAILALRDNKS